MAKILVFLQNAWLKSERTYLIIRKDAEARGRDPDEAWLYSWKCFLAWSRSGKRLKYLLDDDCFENDDITFTNTTPKVAYGKSNICLPTDSTFVKDELKRYEPKLVVACGQQAEFACTFLWDGSLLAVPHPASRVLTNEVYKQGRLLIREHLVQKLHGPKMRFRLYPTPAGKVVLSTPRVELLAGQFQTREVAHAERDGNRELFAEADDKQLGQADTGGDQKSQ